MHSFFVILAVSGLLLPPADKPPTSLAAMRNRFRPVLIFAPPGDPRIAAQVQLLQQHRADLIERQVMLVPFYRKYAGPVETETTTFLARDEEALRRQFRIDEHSFTVILIGKDGGEKLRSDSPVTIDRLMTTIDAMPMRKQEMVRGGTELHNP